MKKHAHIWKILGFDMFVIEFGPVGVFFIAYYLSDFPIAALSLGIATFIALVLSKIINKRVPWFAIFSGSITMITSAVTYYFDAPVVLILKDTIYYFLFAGILAYSMWRGKYLFKAFFGHIFAITDNGWRTLQRRWLGFFLLAGSANELVRIFLTTAEWVLYKQVLVVVFLVFGLYQLRVSNQERTEEGDRWGIRKLAHL
jgi:intracellular septation protein